MIEIAPGAILVVKAIEDVLEPLLPSEAHLAFGATPARRRELLAGRTTARIAMSHLCDIAAPVLANAAGAPLWPPEYCGSLSHTSCHVAALVALKSNYDSLGVDIDDGRPLGEAVSNIASVKELELLKAIGLSQNPDQAGCVAFSVKESIFKCQYPLTGDDSLDFSDIHLVLGEQPKTLKFMVTSAGRPVLHTLALRIRINIVFIQGLMVTSAVLQKGCK